jgi:uncharacterized protein (UPF0212 family)
LPDYLVTLESAWIIKDVKSLDDAIGIAISEAGKRLNPQAKYVEVEAGILECPFCEGELNSAIVVADTALVGLSLEMKVFRAETPEHASRIARSVIGKALRDVPLTVKDVQELLSRSSGILRSTIYAACHDFPRSTGPSISSTERYISAAGPRISQQA